jgi:ArsR family transcriptional regulator
MGDSIRKAQLFKTLAHPARLAILDILRAEEACVCHLEAALGQRQAYISQQLMVLRAAGLIQDRREGWNVFYHVADPSIFRVIDAACGVVGEAPGHPSSAPSGCVCPKCSAVATGRLEQQQTAQEA